MTPELFQRIASDPATFEAELTVPSAQGPHRFGAIMADFQRERFAAVNDALIAVANGEKPSPGKAWLEAVKGNSKTSDLAIVALWLLAFAKRPLLIQVGAADQDQAAELRRAVNEILLLNDWLAEVVAVQSNKIVCSRTGSTCEILAADVAGSHGARPDVLILDEVVHVAKTEFLENLLDNSSKIPHCLTIVATNAGFTGTWAWRFRELARTSPRWYFHQRTEPAPWIDACEMEEARRRNTPTRYARLWQGVWSSGTGDAIDPNDVAACVTMPGPMEKPDPAFVFVGGLDLGIKHDHSALVILGIHRQNRRRRLAMVKRWAPEAGTGKVDLTKVQAGVKAAFDLFQPRSIYYDPYQADLMAVQLRKQGCRMVEIAFSGGNLNSMASEFIEQFTSRNIDLYNDAGLLRDIGRLTIVEKSYGYKLDSVRDTDGHADSAIALALALMDAKHTPAGGAFEITAYVGGQRFSSTPPTTEDEQKQADASKVKQGAVARFMPRFLSAFGRGDDEESRPLGRAKIVKDDLVPQVRYVDTTRESNRPQRPIVMRNAAEMEQAVARILSQK
jgi:phage terminase large subunit-like protein